MRYYSEKKVIEIAREAVGLWRDEHNAKVYRGIDFFGHWIVGRLNKEAPITLIDKN